MRIVVTGASGNVGSYVLEALGDDVVVAVARRPPSSGPLAAAATWIACDLSSPESIKQLTVACRGADAVIHLAWLIQPSHDEPVMRSTNVDGTAHLLSALRALASEGHGVPALIVASSVGAYSPGSKEAAVSESWPTDGIPSSPYSRHKVAVERLLDQHEREVEGRVVRIRPGVILAARAASAQARYFLGPFVPMNLVRPSLVPLVPAPRRLTIPIVHAHDAAAAFVAAARNGAARGAFNVAAQDPLTPELLGRIFHARTIAAPERLLRSLVDVSWKMRLQPTDAGWLDLAFQTPLMSIRRAQDDLRWAPVHTAEQTLVAALEGLRAKSGGPTPVLRPSHGALQQAVAALPTLIPKLGKRI